MILASLAMDSDIEHPTETTALLPKEPTALSPSPSNTSVSTTDVTVDKCGRPQSSSSYGSSSFVRNLQCISSFTVSWHNLTVKKIGSDKLILDNVCGVAKSGQFVALMGARYFILLSLRTDFFGTILSNLTSCKFMFFEIIF